MEKGEYLHEQAAQQMPAASEGSQLQARQARGRGKVGRAAENAKAQMR